jgi:hypothetical protein
MKNAFGVMLRAVEQWCGSHGISIYEQSLPSEKAGEFDGVSVVMNSDFPAEQRLYYLTHAVGSIVARSLDPERIQQMYDELRDAKEASENQPERLDRAIARYRDFEIESSGFAVWLLDELGYPDVVSSYTNFMRADLEAMTEFHRTGHAPVWRDFFDRWNSDVEDGRRLVLPFHAKPIPPFKPVRTEKQEILQR